MRISEALTKAGAMLDDATWTQGYDAMNAEGDPTEACAPDACRWCMYGAVARVAQVDEEIEAATDYLRDFLRRHYNAEAVADWNDAPERRWWEARRALLNAGAEAERNGR